MNILVCFKYIYDEDELYIKPDRTVDLTGAQWVVSPYDLNTIEASMKLAAAVGDSNVYMLTVGGEVLDNSKMKKSALSRGPAAMYAVKADNALELDNLAVSSLLKSAVEKIGDVDLVVCGGYVGGDITAGLLFTGIRDRRGKSLFIDVGTNGEMALGDIDGIAACSVASGPAFEGAEISCGMPAAEGAVSAVELTDGGLQYEVIGGGEACGLCGSGLLDLVACLLELGYIDESGCLEENEDGEAAFYLTDKVFITQRDVRQLQLAKAAVAAGIRLLLREGKLDCKELETVYLAGGFGNRLRVESAIRIGMLPSELSGRIIPAGNASLAGAEQVLLMPKARDALQDIQKNCRYIELSADAEFNEAFVEEMTFPEVIV